MEMVEVTGLSCAVAAQEQAQAASRAVKPHKGMRPAHTSIADLSMRLPLASHAATTGRDAADARLVDDWRDIWSFAAFLVLFTRVGPSNS